MYVCGGGGDFAAGFASWTSLSSFEQRWTHIELSLSKAKKRETSTRERLFDWVLIAVSGGLSVGIYVKIKFAKMGRIFHAVGFEQDRTPPLAGDVRGRQSAHLQGGEANLNTRFHDLSGYLSDFGCGWPKRCTTKLNCLHGPGRTPSVAIVIVLHNSSDTLRAQEIFRLVIARLFRIRAMFRIRAVPDSHRVAGQVQVGAPGPVACRIRVNNLATAHRPPPSLLPPGARRRRRAAAGLPVEYSIVVSESRGVKLSSPRRPGARRRRRRRRCRVRVAAAA